MGRGEHQRSTMNCVVHGDDRCNNRVKGGGERGIKARFVDPDLARLRFLPREKIQDAPRLRFSFVSSSFLLNWEQSQDKGTSIRESRAK